MLDLISSKCKYIYTWGDMVTCVLVSDLWGSSPEGFIVLMMRTWVDSTRVYTVQTGFETDSLNFRRGFSTEGYSSVLLLLQLPTSSDRNSWPWE